MSESFEFDPVSRITAGAVGEPGSRSFFIQVRGEGRLITLACEKEQVEALAATLGRLLEAMPPIEDEGEPVGDDELELEEPIEPVWRIGPMGIELEESRDMIVLVMQEATEEEDEEGASARIVATRAQMRALADHAATVVAAGRPRCRLCGFPLEAGQEHVCPALNGHRTPEGS